ncbi:hypothetical protein ABFX02_14G065100 [Erythranthe guttata]
MDGFDLTVNVKVIMATNRADTLDPALLRPGRLDRRIKFPLPDRRQKRLIFQVKKFHYFIKLFCIEIKKHVFEFLYMFFSFFFLCRFALRTNNLVSFY